MSNVLSLCHKKLFLRVHLDALLGTSCCQHLGQGGVGVARVKAVLQSQRIRPHVLGNEERCHKREGEPSFFGAAARQRGVRYTARAPKNQRCFVETERQFDIHTHTLFDLWPTRTLIFKESALSHTHTQTRKHTRSAEVKNK
jgi:hypothetical protein